MMSLDRNALKRMSIESRLDIIIWLKNENTVFDGEWICQRWGTTIPKRKTTRQTGELPRENLTIMKQKNLEGCRGN